MTYEELSAEAAKLGYHLIPNRKPEKFKPCRCGVNRRDHIYKNTPYGQMDGLRCQGCGLAVWSYNENYLKKLWNEEVTKHAE